MITRSPSRYMYLLLQLLAKKAEKVSKIHHNHKMKHENSDSKIVDN